MFQEKKFRRIGSVMVLAAVVVVMAGCHNNKAPNPIANLDSKQPDKVLFDRAMQSIHQNKFDTARITLQTLINTYPDSEYIARAKLAVGDSWFAEGGTAALQQAEVEYKDFQTFFPNMPEAAEAQLKVAGIHYKEMEKPDRDYTQAKRAEDEYRQLIQQYPDSKLVPEAKERLRQVQEVLAEREFRIGKFYFGRESYAAAIARLKSLVDAYPLYSQADEALYMLGQTYQMQAEKIRATLGGSETVKANMVRKIEDQAAGAYSQIITRYPAMARKDDAVAKLKAMNRPVPTPTPEALAKNKAEEASRGDVTRMGKIMGNFHKGPDVAHAATIGEPTMEDPKSTNATDVVKNMVEMAKQSGAGESNATVETVKPGSTENQPVPRSDATAPADAAPAGTSSGSTSSDNSAPAPPPTQVNDAKTDPGTASSSSADNKPAATDKKDESTSKPKKKKGLRKLIPF
jgi:outer membrane protein assembly factor BamD